MILEVLRADPPRGLAEFEPRVDLSMGRKIIEMIFLVRATRIKCNRTPQK